ncbi:hypothetical protein FC82_GL002972 [Secundilactobacillus collinoides DSM 20515 = JCM 1123]|uniref:Uncharacterized protein n=1 Tax=Secundilactobacillus collinoides DSM 20515 = JCM 1123 TaxID=1423733 RepID=A0A0R2BE36_SECCO|nr:hypothetical protein FC82_GL002972 [Secundilactobacillus collinoides DSM 20515 = JCM 1123]
MLRQLLSPFITSFDASIRGGLYMRYIIFFCELLLIVLWVLFGPSALWLKIIGIIVIIICSQIAHILLKAR